MPNAALSKGRMKVRGRIPDLRSMLEQLGVGAPLIGMAIENAFMLPRTTDPYSAGMIITVKGIQRGLNRLGFDLGVDGGLGEQTSAALEIVSGPNWYDKSWVQLMGDVLSAEPLPPRPQRLATPGTALGQGVATSALTGALPWIFGAWAIYWFGFRKKARGR